MAWWPKRIKGRHAAGPGEGHPDVSPLDRVTADLKESIMRRPEVDRLAALVRKEFGARP